jgi:predicted nucleotidyltransferase
MRECIADEIVEELPNRLSCHSDDLYNIFSVYISGSYIRGDFNDNNSDLDISVVFQPECDNLFQEDPAYKMIQFEVQRTIGERKFHSHTPGGVDWNPIRWEWLPTPKRGPSIPGPGPYYPPFGIFLFDLHKHLKLCWGEDPRPHLVKPPAPISMARSWYESSLVKLGRYNQLNDRAAGGTFKSLQLAQIIFGELTLDKNYLPVLYADYVPDFPMKDEGSRLIKEMIGARYPHHPPNFDTPDHYMKLVEQLWSMIQEEKVI